MGASAENLEGEMPGNMITVVQLCGVCNSEVGTFSEKQENLMLSTVDYIWCEKCQAVMSAVRDIEGREAAAVKEVESYPTSLPS